MATKRTAALQKAIIELIFAHGGYAWRNSNQPRFTDNGKAFFADPNSYGTPDIIAIMPDGLTLWIEVKVGRDKLSESQKRFRDVCVQRGHTYVVVRDTIDELAKHLTAPVAAR